MGLLIAIFLSVKVLEIRLCPPFGFTKEWPIIWDGRCWHGHACIRVSCIQAAVCASAVMASGLMGVGFMVLFQWVSEKVYALTGSASEPVVVYSLASALASSMCMARA